MASLIATALDTARARGAEHADIRLVSNREQRIVVRNGVVETMTADQSVGLGIRAVYRGVGVRVDTDAVDRQGSFQHNQITGLRQYVS